MSKKGFVTLPVEVGQEKLSLELAKKLGADAFRNSDGTEMPEELLSEDYDIYSTICIVRADQEWARSHMDHCVEKYLMSEPAIARGDTLEIKPMERFFSEKYVIDKKHDAKKYWEVIDRTTDELIDISDWDFDSETETVTIRNCKKYHKYTVTFLVYQIWESVSMYNHMTNNWTCDPIVGTDPYIPESYDHMMEYFEKWLDDNPDTDVVRLTTLAYNFTLDSDENGKPKFVDWLGYTDCVSPMALDDFEKKYGYRLRPEDLVNKGWYHPTQLVPSKKYRDWIDFIHEFVVRFGKDLVERAHARGKKAGIFWGDHWIGVETYSELYQEMKVDINIGACEDGNALRRLADCPGEHTKEIRLYPYFFPDVFREGGDPTGESISNWVKIRRAVLRKPIDRIGWGGYLSLAGQFPDFMEHLENLSGEFHSILEKGGKTVPYSSGIKLVILNAWGSLRSWINTGTLETKFFSAREDVVTVVGSNVQECLAGLPVEISFMSFDELIENGIPEGTNVILNEGLAGSAWSGGDYWKDPRVVCAVREFVDNGGGLIGVGSPSAVEHEGAYFQLSDIFGVERETGKTLYNALIPFELEKEHFITEDLEGEFQSGVEKNYIMPTRKDIKVISAPVDKHIGISTSSYGLGRSVYFASIPYSHENSRLLYRAILWAASKEDSIGQYFSSNVDTDCAYFPETGWLAVANNCGEKLQTQVTNCKNETMDIDLEPYELKWLKTED